MLSGSGLCPLVETTKVQVLDTIIHEGVLLPQKKKADKLRSAGYNDAFAQLQSMIKRAIARWVSEKLNITQQEAKHAGQNVLDAIRETLVEVERIELRNFGVMEIKERAARKARNPRTGDTVQVKKKRVVAFKAGKALEDAVQGKVKKQKNK
jgi:nucleoid DNA-binding protein